MKEVKRFLRWLSSVFIQKAAETVKKAKKVIEDVKKVTDEVSKKK